jgi:hypothetical protein
VLRGTLEQHEQLRALIAGSDATMNRQPGGRRRRHASSTKKVYDLTVVEKPIGLLLGQLAEGLGLELEIDRAGIEAAGLSLERRVSFQVNKASLDELLTEALRPAGLTYKRTAQRVRVTAGP